MPDRDPPEIVQEKRGTADVFSRAASTYDHVGPQFFTHFGRRLVELAQMLNKANVLDVAMGRGANLFPAAETVGSHGYVTGIDLSEAMVQETAKEINRRGLKNAEVRQMDAEHLEFSDASFDCVLCGFSIFFSPNSPVL
jgi:O-methyltransferase/aklanonic acid methyltransferase